MVYVPSATGLPAAFFKVTLNTPGSPGWYEALSSDIATESAVELVTSMSIVFVTVGAVVPAGSAFWIVIVAVPALTPVTAIVPTPAFRVLVAANECDAAETVATVLSLDLAQKLPEIAGREADLKQLP